MNTNPVPGSWVTGWLQCNDSFYPTGAYAHSFGLEGIVQEGMVIDLASFRTFLHHAVLPALARVELPLTAQAFAALGAEDWGRLDLVAQTARAMKAAREPREASEGIGRQRLTLLGLLRPHPLVQEVARRTGAERGLPSSVVVALEAQVLGAPLEAALASVCYGTIASLGAAVMKLLRLGQNGIQKTLTAALAETPSLIASAQVLPFHEIGWSNPWWDIAAARHELAEERMFIS